MVFLSKKIEYMDDLKKPQRRSQLDLLQCNSDWLAENTPYIPQTVFASKISFGISGRDPERFADCFPPPKGFALHHETTI